MRGKHQRGRSLRHARGLIPACAGETTCSHARNLTPKAHPRVCGENVSAPSLLSVHLGSSPRLRGKHRLLRRRDRPLRLIPARAGKTDHGDIQGCRYGAHPRACGENISSGVLMVVISGSSPRVRGKRRRARSTACRARLIPARAGKTRSWTAWWRARSAHPRACGENSAASLALMSACGSSPRVRGNSCRRIRRRSSAGSSPRVRGKHRRRPPRSAVGAAHPRACGENADLVTPTGREKGSSPRVWGKRLRARHADPLRGLIPARAGKTCSWGPWTPAVRAHPRACGENAVGGGVFGGRWGSSPRVRGKPGVVEPGLALPRLIPARAGKTRNGSGLGCGPWAHPRACGENVERLGGSFETLGSSPRVRGKRDLGEAVGEDTGLIPARAGKTMALMLDMGQAPAHPRACGENLAQPVGAADEGGSSPRVRGKQGHSGNERSDPGLIPARAGKTSWSRPPTPTARAHPRACGENNDALASVKGTAGSSPRVRGKRRAIGERGLG